MKQEYMEENTRRTRAKKKLIRVTFPTGKSICYNNATATMIAVLKEIGSEKFPLINLELCHLPILSTVAYPQYGPWMKPVCDGWYLNTQSNSDQKYMQLRSINDQLSLGLTIELGADLATEKNPAKEKKNRIIDKLLVKFPDGEYIASDSAMDTFLETIWKLGIDDIMRKNLSWGSNELITSTKMANNQVQVGERRWIVVPSTTKDKAKLLRVIGAVLRINIEITVI